MSCRRATWLVLSIFFASRLAWAADELANEAQVWRSQSKIARESLVFGFLFGVAEAATEAKESAGDAGCKASIQQVRDRLTAETDATKIAAVVTDLYRDPANVNILASSMIALAIAKLRGEEIEPGLREARALAAEVKKKGAPYR